MEIEELAKTCQEALKWGRKNIAIQVPASKMLLEQKRKLFPDLKGKQPMGKVLQTGGKRDVDVVMFDAIDVLAFLVARGWIDVEFVE